MGGQEDGGNRPFYAGTEICREGHFPPLQGPGPERAGMPGCVSLRGQTVGAAPAGAARGLAAQGLSCQVSRQPPAGISLPPGPDSPRHPNPHGSTVSGPGGALPEAASCRPV